MKLPKLWRKKRGDRLGGSWYITRGGDINLGTTDVEEARRRRLEAVTKGRRKFEDDMDVAADLDAGGAAGGLIDPPVASPAPARESSGPADPPPAPAAPPAIVPDQVVPPPAADDAGDMAAAAEEVTGTSGEAGASSGAGEMPPEALDAFLKNGALLLVDAQLRMQGAIIKRYTGKVAGEVAIDDPLRSAAAEAWVAQLKIWFPNATMLPAWAMALVIPALAIPAQLAGATEPPKDQAPSEAQVVQ